MLTGELGTHQTPIGERNKTYDGKGIKTLRDIRKTV